MTEMLMDEDNDDDYEIPDELEDVIGLSIAFINKTIFYYNYE